MDKLRRETMSIITSQYYANLPIRLFFRNVTLARNLFITLLDNNLSIINKNELKYDVSMV